MICGFKNGKKIIKLLKKEKIIEIISPVNNQKISEFMKCDEKDVNNLVEQSYKSYKSSNWKNDIRFRSTILRNIANVLRIQKERQDVQHFPYLSTVLCCFLAILFFLSGFFCLFDSLLILTEGTELFLSDAELI